jgi:hypothetical protein
MIVKRLAQSRLIGLGIATLIFIAIFTLFYALTERDHPLNAIDLRLPSSYSNGCHLGSLNSDPLPCNFGRSTEPTQVYLFGDSHAAQWIPALESASNTKHFQGRFITKSSCPYVNLNLDENCIKWQSKAIQEIVNEKPDLLILASMTNEPYDKILDGMKYSQEWTEGFNKIRIMLPRDTKLLLINDSPYLSTDPIPCLQKHAAIKCKQMASTSLTSSNLKEFSYSNDIPFVDLTSKMCDSNFCKVGDSKINYFRDVHHISYAYSEKMGEILGKKIVEILKP